MNKKEHTSIEEKIIIRLSLLEEKELLAVRISSKNHLTFYTLESKNLSEELIIEPLKRDNYDLKPYLYSRLLEKKTAYFGYNKQLRQIIVVVEPKVSILSDIYFKKFTDKNIPIFTYKRKTYVGMKALWAAAFPGQKLSDSDRKSLQSLIPQISNMSLTDIKPSDFTLTGYGSFMGNPYPKLSHPSLSGEIKGRNGLIKMIPALAENPDMVDRILEHIGWKKVTKSPRTNRVDEIITKYNISKEREGVVMNSLDDNNAEVVVKSPYMLAGYLKKHNISCSKDTAKRVWEEVNK